MTYSPWADLRGRAPLTLAIVGLPSGRAWWLPGDQAIALDGTLGRVARRCALAHELAHVDLEHRHVELAWLRRRQERDADRLGASRLITAEQLVDGLLWAQDEHELADELDVDVETVRVRLAGLTETEKTEINRRIRAREAETSWQDDD